MRILTLLACCVCCFSSIAQQPMFEKDTYKTTFSVSSQKTTETIKVDGELKEVSWATAAPAQNFWEHWPNDREMAKRKTEVRIIYDDNNIYVSAICFDSTASLQNYTIQTLKRDQRFSESDGFSVIIDPMGQATNGFLFGVNPYNVQSEGLLTPNIPIDYAWDNSWMSATKRLKDRWVVEMAIPFRTLRYQSGKTSWSINFVRNDIKSNQYHTWAWVPVNFETSDLGYTGNLVFSGALPDPKRSVSLIPYTTATAKGGKLATDKKTTGNGGFDAKIALTSSMNLDLTVNPDFSQVEVDRQVTNLTRFNIFFPERRTFFLENDDLFSGYLYPEIRPFYTRRIGLDNVGNRIPIIAGARLSGNIDKKTRLGIMNIQTGEKDGFAAQNYTAVSAQRRVLKRSYAKGYFLNRQGFLSDEQKRANPLDESGRNSGIELVYSNNEGTINGWGGYHLSWKPGVKGDNEIKNIGFQYAGRKFNGFVDVNLVGTNYYADMGFVQRIENYDALKDSVMRLGFKQGYAEINYSIYPNDKKIGIHRFGVETYLVYNPNNSLNERYNRLRYFINFKNTSYLRLRYDNIDLRLLFPTQLQNDILSPGTYTYNQYNAQYQSDSRKKIVYGGSVRAGKLYNGDYQQYIATLTYRAQPWGNFAVNFERNIIKFPSPFIGARLTLIAPRIEVNFTNSIFWTTFVQYNTQQNNFNINSRLQWRYKPMSDIFLVYTDNYFSDPFMKNKTRAIVFKANYWLNL